MTDATDEGEHAALQRAAILWVLAIFGGMALMFALTQWGLVNQVPRSDIAGILAIGTHNAIGFIAFGGWNAIGLVAVGGANSIGVITIGGLNSIGIISIGGLNSVGLITLGGFNSTAAIWGVRILQWSPVRLRRGRPVS